MLQRRRCRCCVTCIIILVICISVFYLTSIRSISFNSYVDISKYPDFRKYAKNIGDSLGTAINGGNNEDDVLNGIQLRLLMKDSVDTPKYNPSKINGADADRYVQRKGEEIPNANEILTIGENGKFSKTDENAVKIQPGKLIVNNGINENDDDTGEESNNRNNNNISVLKNKMSDSLNREMPKEATQVKGHEELDQETIAEKSSNLDIKPTHIVIVTNRRSGSSFLGQIFNQNPDIFFHFEPLKVTEWKKEWYPNSTNLVRNIMKCKFDDTPFLMDMYNKEVLHRESSHVLKSPPLCDLTKLKGKYFNPVRFCPNLTNNAAIEVCKHYKHIVVKMIRMYSLSSLEEIVRDPALNVKVIHLVRDPRGIYISRTKAEKKVLTIGAKLDQDVKYTCRRIKRNLEFVNSAPTWLEGKYIRVRYEDVAEDPTLWTQKLYSFTGLGDVPKAVEKWINFNTQKSSGNMYSTQRNSATTAQAWRKDASIDIVTHMQDLELCRPVLSELGYLEVDSELELTNLTYSLVV